MKLHEKSHVDHGLTPAQVEHIVARFADRDAFFIETIELPLELGKARCDLFGPLVGDEPIPESEVFYEKRGDREWKSRMIEAAYERTTRKVTVIAGPLDERELGCGDQVHACVLYTAFGGPLAPHEPGDPKCRDAEVSREFWAKHALRAAPR